MLARHMHTIMTMQSVHRTKRPSSRKNRHSSADGNLDTRAYIQLSAEDSERMAGRKKPGRRGGQSRSFSKAQGNDNTQLASQQELTQRQSATMLKRYATEFAKAKNNLDIAAMQALSPLVSHFCRQVFCEQVESKAPLVDKEQTKTIATDNSGSRRKMSDSTQALTALSASLNRTAPQPIAKQPRTNQPTRKQTADAGAMPQQADTLSIEELGAVATEVAKLVGPYMWQGAPVHPACADMQVDLNRVTEVIARDLMVSVAVVQVAALSMNELQTFVQSQEFLSSGQDYWQKQTVYAKIMQRVTALSGCALNYAFVKRILVTHGAWQTLLSLVESGPQHAAELDAKADDQTGKYGVQADVGSWDEKVAKDKLTAIINVSGDDAMDVFSMIMSAAVPARASLVSRLDTLGVLETFCDNLPRKRVEQLFDSMTDPMARRQLYTHIEGKGYGESLHKMAQNKAQSLRAEGSPVLAELLSGADFAHNLMTFGFAHSYADVLDAYEEGELSFDGWMSEATIEVVKTAAIAAASGGVGMYAGTAARAGVAASGSTTLMANAGGVVAGGLAENATAIVMEDGYDIVRGRSDGFDLPSMGLRTLQGTALNLGVAGVKAGVSGTVNKVNSGRSSFNEKLKTTTGQENPVGQKGYMADPLAWVNDLIPGQQKRLGEVQNTVASKVHLERAKIQYSRAKQKGADVDGAKKTLQLAQKNTGLETEGRVMAKLVNESQIQAFLGEIQGGTLQLRNKTATMGGFVTYAEDMQKIASASPAEMLEELGMSNKGNDYYRENYMEQLNKLWIIEFETPTTAKAQIPAAGDNAPGTVIGKKNELWRHKPGVGETVGNLPEGELARNTPARIVRIYKAGNPEITLDVKLGTKKSPAQQNYNPQVATNIAVTTAPVVAGVQKEKITEAEEKSKK